MPTYEGLREQDQELIAIGASIAAGCRPCTQFHVRAATAAGAGKAEIRRAIDQALEARRSASDHMARLAERLLVEIPKADPDAEREPAFLAELVATSAALAVNCGPDLAAHVSRARDRGATEERIRGAFEIARMVRAMAAKRAETAARRSAPDPAGETAACQPAGQLVRARQCSCTGAEQSVAR
jgi:AhpD family alkylhydroperoxidase